MTITETTGLRERKKQRTRELLASRAVALVAERGVAAVRVEDICESAEVGRSTFFRYFESKESAIVEGIHGRLVDALAAAAAAQPSDLSGLDALGGAVVVIGSRWRTFRDAMLLEARLRAESPAVDAWASSSARQWVSVLADAVLDRVDGSREHAEVLAGAVIAAVQVGYAAWIADGATGDPTPIVQRCLDRLRAL